MATWRITGDVSNDLELDGPFGIYSAIRNLCRRESMPEWIRDGIDCPYCVSFWIGHCVALLLPIYSGHTWLQAAGIYLAVSWAMSGAITFHMRRMKILYQAEATEV